MATPVPENQTITLVDTLSGAKTISLPAVSTCLGRVVTITDVYGNAAASNITVQTTGDDSILFFSTPSIVLSNNGASVSVMAGPSNLWVVLNYWNGTL